jgi:hypothetical protein
MYTLQWKPDQYATHFPLSVRIWPLTIHISRGPHLASFYESSTRLYGCTALKKKWSRLHLTTQLSGQRDPPQFLSQHNHWSQHVINMFNTCSQEPIHRSLTNTGRSYNLGGAGLPHHTPQPFQPAVLRFPPRGPSRSLLINPTITNWTRDGTNPKSH